MGVWILDGREAPAVACTISGTMTLHEVLTTPLDDLSLPGDRIVIRDDRFDDL